MKLVLDFIRNGLHYNVYFSEEDYQNLHRNDTFQKWEIIHDSSGLKGFGAYLTEENVKSLCEAFHIVNYKIEIL